MPQKYMSDATDLVKIEETKHLAKTVALVLEGKLTLEKAMAAVGAKNLERLKEFREDGMDAYDPDFFFFLESLQQQNETFDIKYKYQRLTEFEQMLKTPYFARIDLSYPADAPEVLPEDSQENRRLYIGKVGYTRDAPIIIDWRAKIASVYYRYRYPQKGVKYETPEGSVVANLDLKRTFELDDGHLLKYFNNDIQLDENELIIDKIETRTGGVLEDIVETIQLSQLDIIESDPRQVCIVQGCVGSGKSTVAIHKLAHIFFNFPDLIHPAKSILIAKNQILVSYLSTLFPKLGIFDINYKTIRELIVHIVFRERLKIKVDLDLGQDTNGISLPTLQEVQKRLGAVHLSTEKTLKDLFTSDEEYQLFAGYKYSKNSTPYENIVEIVNDLNEELLSQRENLKLNPMSSRAWFFKENVKILRKLITRLNKIGKDIKVVTLPKLAAAEGVPVKGSLDYTETLLYLYLYSELVGITKYPKYEYCVVDEGQDFSVLEYAFLSKMVLRGRFSILGDLNQSLESDGISSWDDVTKVIKEAQTAATFQLDTNYRSTKPIIDCANRILSPYTAKFLPKSINRAGDMPTIETFQDNTALLENFTQCIKHDLIEIDKSVGVICMTPDLTDMSAQILESLHIPSEKYIRLEPKTAIQYIPKGVYLMEMADCKGLEFAKVYILGLNLSTIATFPTARAAFVAVTRAMNELVVLGTGK
jgi:DNA helicase II / ATP-dependent DNA helicase PcrA